MTFFFDFTSLVEIKPLNSLDLRTVAFGTVRMWREVTGLILSKLLILQKEQFENTFYIIIYITNYHDLKLEIPSYPYFSLFRSSLDDCILKAKLS